MIVRRFVFSFPTFSSSNGHRFSHDLFRIFVSYAYRVSIGIWTQTDRRMTRSRRGFNRTFLGRRQWERKRNRSQAGHCCWLFMNDSNARWHRCTPRTVDIGQSRSRSPGEPNFENGKLVCPVFASLFDCSGVGRPRVDPKEASPAGPRGTPLRRSLFQTAVQSVPVVTGRSISDSFHSYTRRFLTQQRFTETIVQCVSTVGLGSISIG